MGWVAAAAGIFSAGMGLFGAGKQEDVDIERVGLAYEDNLEKIRRRKFTQGQVLGVAVAKSQASGVRHTGGSSAQGFIDTMSQEFKKELDWMKAYSERARRLGIKSAGVTADANRLGAVIGGLNTASSVYGMKG